ncbi:uncharacterized protein [Panulirus ornatus]|uniref:uncharacterized protein n=1 Tax=Panulirus ornatus TaxID=150431 RepID=UPI003A877000
MMSSDSRKTRGSERDEEEEEEEVLLLTLLAEVKPPAWVTVQEVIQNSNKFPATFPVHTARLSTLLQVEGHEEKSLEEKVNSAYPLVHERVLPLLASFLTHKRTHGRRREKELYSSLNILDLVDRLLKKRPVVFFNPNDNYVLRDGTEGSDGFEEIGHSHEKANLCLQEYMSYDEMKLSALLCLSSRSVFINDGSRHNRGVPGAQGTFQPEGVIVGMVGSRLEREGVMEWQDCVVTPEQNTPERGYTQDPPPRRGLVREWGRLWEAAPLPTWEEAQAAPEGNFISLLSKVLFNKQLYHARIQLSAETLLCEAGARGAAAGLKAYVHVAGLGLGVWKISGLQNQVFVDAWGDALGAVDTTHIAYINFSWTRVSTCRGVGEGEVFPGTEVRLHFSQRYLHTTVPPATLLIATYAMDSNAMPGNEYWKGMLSASGEAAAACSSGVAELHNALINPRITAHNLHVASSGHVEHVADYARRKLEERKRCSSSGKQ